MHPYPVAGHGVITMSWCHSGLYSMASALYKDPTVNGILSDHAYLDVHIPDISFVLSKTRNARYCEITGADWNISVHIRTPSLAKQASEAPAIQLLFLHKLVI